MIVGGLAVSPLAGELKLVTTDLDQRDDRGPLDLGPTDARERCEPIGAPLGSTRSDLLRHGEHLLALMPEGGAAFVRDALRVLEHQVCTMAVIGHVRSGKSSFINALAQQPELLPTDVGPWTSAVTRLHFGVAQAPDGIAAEFQLYETDEWERLASGDDRVRDLTHQLVPGFEPTLLRGQIEAMQQRAGQRLGENFGGEIGAKHRHEVLTREVLARYFTFAGAPATEDQGRYAEITSAADLYFKSDGAPFRLPLTVIETPGVNDPFLVRDEISRRAFESADVHIAVLNARQPLSAAELAHLRILRGLHKDRIVVFINRIDELADVVIDTRRVLAEVRQTLEHEFPGAEIPVVAGSARWGTLAIEPELSDDQDVLTPALLASARHKRVLPRVGIEDGDADEAAEDISTDQLRRALSVCSGFEELSVALNQVLLRCHSAHLIRQVASYFAELAQLNEASLREEHRRDVEQAEMMAAESIERQRDLQRMQAELACIRQIAAEVERRLGGLQSSLNDIVLEQRNSLLDGVFAFFQQFVEAEGEKLLNEVGSGRAVRQWRCDTTPLRHVVEEQLERARQTAEDRLRQSADNIFPVLREAMLRRFPYLNLPPPPDADGVIAGAVSVTLPDSVALDGGRGLWSLGKARGISAEEPDRELEWALREAFVPAIEELIRSADSRLEQHARESSDYAAATSVAVMEALRKESDMLIARAAQLLEAQQARAVEDQELDKRTAQQREQLVIAEALNRRLSEVCQRCNELVG